MKDSLASFVTTPEYMAAWKDFEKTIDSSIGELAQTTIRSAWVSAYYHGRLAGHQIGYAEGIRSVWDGDNA